MASTPAAEFAARHLTRGMKRMTDFVLTSGSGSRVRTECGRDLLDFTTGIAVTNLGHCHPRVVEAVREQAGQINHVQVNIALHRPMLSLVEKLTQVTPRGLDSFFFWNSGAEAVEAAIKVARKVTGRGEIIVLDGSYHGRTLGTMPLTTSGNVYRGSFGPFMPGVHVAPFQSCFRCNSPASASGASGSSSSAADGCPSTGCCMEPVDGLDLLLRRSAAGADIAAVIVEPVQGEGGYLPAPAGYLEALRERCDEMGAMLIFDEIQSGAGRTGKWFALEHYNAVPDILIMAKGIASGYPLSAIAASKQVMDAMEPGSMGGTYAGNAVACAAACATVDAMREENVLENAQARGVQLRAGLRRIAEAVPALRDGEWDVRGLGLMNAIEFHRGKDKTGIAAEIAQASVDRGMLLLPTGAWDTIRFMPPLNVSEAETDEALGIFEDAVKHVYASKQ